jgi:IclR family transcriptional regulator, acetate operon repressor
MRTSIDGAARRVAGSVSADRTARVLLQFLNDASADHGVTEIARAAALPKATVHRLLAALAAREIVVAESGRYRLGPATVALGARALRESRLRIVAVPFLRRLQEETGETAAISMVLECRWVYLAQAVSRRPGAPQVDVGRSYSLADGAPGKAILAFASSALQRAVAGDRSVDDLAMIRRDGYAVEVARTILNVNEIAAPIGSVGHAVVGSVSMCVPFQRSNATNVRRWCELVRTFGRSIGEHLEPFPLYASDDLSVNIRPRGVRAQKVVGASN